MLGRWFRRRSDRAAVSSSSAELQTLRETQAVSAALLAATTRLASGGSRDAIVQSLCDSVVAATPHIRLAWFWVGAPDAPEIRPLIAAGPARPYAEQLVIRRNLLTERGPALRALRANRADVTRMFRLAPFGPWREAFERWELRMAIALPLRVSHDDARGLLVFYADDRHYFRRVGTAPFEAFARLSEVALAQTAERSALAAHARTDALTRLPNRRAAHEACVLALAGATPATPVTVLLADIDRFKSVNDAYGHEEGDRVLTAVAGCLAATVREGDLVGRWGGEEFFILLPGTALPEAVAIAERLRHAVERLAPRLPDGTALTVTCSIGLAVGRPDDTVESLVRSADRGLIAAKRAGRNRIRNGADAPPPTLVVAA